MSDRSIRSFALDYYRKRGAAVVPLEGEAEAFAITPREGAGLVVTFAEEAPAAPDAGMVGLTATSPQWRAILEDLTADVAVSYRYLVSAPIANPARTLEAALPEGWAVASARLVSVANRHAVGFSHRVTFDAPALNARREVMHHHLWDLAEGVRLTALESALYEAPTLMIRPDRFPPEAVIKGFLDRSLMIVDVDTDARGRTIEAELAALLGEVETRTNQYYEQQMGHVLQREAQLVEKLEATMKRVAEARTPELVARYRQDAASLQGQITHAREAREATLGEIEAACTRKLLVERERHELTAMTDLVAVCHAAYDVLTYEAAVAAPGGEPVTLQVRYWPVSKELQFPACPGCQGPMTEPRALTGGGIGCADCAVTCRGCGAAGSGSATLGTCLMCETGVCGRCEIACTRCAGVACAEHAARCSACADPLCARCVVACSVCQVAVCHRHAHVDPQSGHLHCKDHRPAEFVLAPIGSPTPGLAATPAPQGGGEELSAQGDLPLTPSGGGAPHRLPGGPTHKDSAGAEVGAPAAPAPDPLVAFTAAMLGGGSETPEALRASAEDVGMPLTLFTPVVSSLSGRSMHPRLAETCPACGDHFTVQEMVDCATCGVPACRRCASGELAPCPACESLAPTVASDPRLGYVFTAYPELAEGARTWEVANVGPYVVTHWSRWGAWGMVVYHAVGDAPPVVVTEFRYGRMAVLKQALGLGKGRA